MQISVDCKEMYREWPEVEKYQNSTLRYPPYGDFPPYWEKVIGRPKIMRCTLTLDDVWDYRTDEYFWNFEIGANRYQDDPSNVTYDCIENDYPNAPRGIGYIEYITSHAAYADEVILMFRRYERAVAEGYISLEKYEQVIERTLEHYKELCPNIRYVEINEPNCEVFGNLTMFEFYPLFKQLYKAAGGVNNKHSYASPILVGGPCNASGIDGWHQWEEFMRLYLLDMDERKQLDFYSIHDYNSDIYRIEAFYKKHTALVTQMGLEDLPIFYDEYGIILPTRVDADSLINASGTIAAMILGSHYKDLYIFPWCSYHDPVIQRSNTHFIRNGRGQYIPTPCGHAMKMLSMLRGREIKIEGNSDYRAVAVTNGLKTMILVTNYSNSPERVSIVIENAHSDFLHTVEYCVDSLHNNCFADAEHYTLEVTVDNIITVSGGKACLSAVLEPYAFAIWEFLACET